MIEYRELRAEEIGPALFRHFRRRQVVTKCWRRVAGRWIIRDDPFLDDWSEQEITELAAALKMTAAGGGLVLGAFMDGELKGFASVEPEPLGVAGNTRDLSNLHVSEERRGQGIGTALFRSAAAWARGRGAEKLYISAHSAVETQAFYRAMGCVEAAEYDPRHVEKEPFDCQMEYRL